MMGWNYVPLPITPGRLSGDRAQRIVNALNEVRFATLERIFAIGGDPIASYTLNPGDRADIGSYVYMLQSKIGEIASLYYWLESYTDARNYQLWQLWTDDTDPINHFKNIFELAFGMGHNDWPLPVPDTAMHWRLSVANLQQIISDMRTVLDLLTIASGGMLRQSTSNPGSRCRVAARVDIGTDPDIAQHVLDDLAAAPWYPPWTSMSYQLSLNLQRIWVAPTYYMNSLQDSGGGYVWFTSIPAIKIGYEAETAALPVECFLRSYPELKAWDYYTGPGERPTTIPITLRWVPTISLPLNWDELMAMPIGGEQEFPAGTLLDQDTADPLLFRSAVNGLARGRYHYHLFAHGDYNPAESGLAEWIEPYPQGSETSLLARLAHRRSYTPPYRDTIGLFYRYAFEKS